MHHLVEGLTSFVTHIISSFGNIGIFLSMALESACIPLPSEVILLFGGFLAARGTLTFWGVVSAGVLGNVVGSVLIYWIGSYVGRAFLEKYGKYVLLNVGHLAKAESWFARYGEWAVFFGRILPVIRTFISLPAGVARMNFSKFLMFTLFGCIPWNIALTYFGLKLGQNWQSVEPYFHPVSYVILFIVAVAILRFFYKLVRTRTS
ncbi:DedA family protein [Aneurinibacillus terranovensis]|uniref:DedA family protein n=1 Tax=Aneurinibacillus terranovensis TaxID=278991 RepID=UPI000403C368|nr:DedA family protein [Aneurinibacillus terranovensis]